jgi:hypothetical protein
LAQTPRKETAEIIKMTDRPSDNAEKEFTADDVTTATTALLDQLIFRLVKLDILTKEQVLALFEKTASALEAGYKEDLENGINQKSNMNAADYLRMKAQFLSEFPREPRHT